MKVDKSKIRTPDEEYAYLWQELNKCGNFFAWDVHPNVLRADKIRKERLRNRINILVDSVEFQEYNQWYK